MFLRICLGLALAGSAAAVSARYVPPPGPDAPIEEAQKFFTEDPDAPTVAPNGYDVTVVQYLDYQCPACRTTHQPLKQLLAKDRKIRLIYRDSPIFGPVSGTAARLALASKYQGKYVAFHGALLTTPRPLNDDKIKAAAVKAGVDWATLQRDLKANATDIDDLIERNGQQADMLGLDGTPGFIIGGTQSFGGMTLKELEESVREARADLAKSKTRRSSSAGK